MNDRDLGETTDRRDEAGLGLARTLVVSEAARAEVDLLDGTAAGEPASALAESATPALDQRALDQRALPERLDRYIVLGMLGAGGMGVVYAAYDPDLDRKLALKVLNDGQTGELTKLRLLREAQALARVSDPNVIQVYDVGTVDARVFIAMEFVQGVSLRDWIDGGPRSLREITGAFAQAARGLLAAHRKGVVHRDFKPNST